MSLFLFTFPTAFLLCCCAGYLCGSIPFGLLFARTFCNIDPRYNGSNNIGTTNIARLCGKKWGIITLFFDLAKGAVPVLLAANIGTATEPHPYAFFPDAPVLLSLLAGAFAIMGHMLPVWLKFKGGKGVATTVGVFLALAPIPFLCSGIVFLLITKATGFVSAGSLGLSVSLPIFLVCFGYRPEAVLAFIIALGIIFAHRENIKRLMAGTEKSWKKPPQA